jgi:hypothetical protein
MRSAPSLGNKTSHSYLAVFLCIGLIAITALSCKKSGVEEDGPPSPTHLVFSFENTVDSLPLILDTLKYRNSSGDLYKVTDLQYFISDIVLHRHGGETFTFQTDDGIHYIDARIASSLYWLLTDNIPSGNYDSISFTFGINAVKNISNRFPNPPERDMNWPDILGGGYHYMKMNLVWKKDSMTRTLPFDFHLGIGQIYKGNVINTDSIIRYVQNFFYVKLPASSVSIDEGQTKLMVISMNVNRWFTGEDDFDFAKYPNMMMQDQDAIHEACLNGRHAFSIRPGSTLKSMTK